MQFGDAVVLMVGHRTCDLQVMGLSPGWAPLHSVKLLTPVCLCRQAVLFGISQGGDLFGWESNRGPSGKQRHPTTGFMTNVTYGLTAKKQGSSLCPTLVIEHGNTLHVQHYRHTFSVNMICLNL